MLDLPTHPTLLDPRTGEPLRAIYVTRRGVVVWPQIGGSDSAGDAGASGGDGGGQGDTGASGGDTGAGQQQGTGTGKEPNFTGDFDEERAKRAIAAARDAEKKAKVEAQAAKERLEQILKAAGLTPDGKTDPEAALKAAAEERDKAVAAAREASVQLAVYKLAGKAGGDPNALLDSRTFLDRVKDLNPSAADFADKVSEAIKEAVKANPKLAATQAGAQGGQGPARQGADHTGGTGGKQRPTSLGAAVAAAMRKQ